MLRVCGEVSLSNVNVQRVSWKRFGEHIFTPDIESQAWLYLSLNAVPHWFPKLDIEGRYFYDVVIRGNLSTPSTTCGLSVSNISSCFANCDVNAAALESLICSYAETTKVSQTAFLVCSCVHAQTMTDSSAPRSPRSRYKLGISKSCVTLHSSSSAEAEEEGEGESSRPRLTRDHPSRRDLEIIEGQSHVEVVHQIELSSN